MQGEVGGSDEVRAAEAALRAFEEVRLRTTLPGQHTLPYSVCLRGELCRRTRGHEVRALMMTN